MEQDAPSKFSKKGGGGVAKKPVGVVRSTQKPTPKTASNTVQDQLFDYLGEMLKKTVVSDERETAPETQVTEDFDLDDL